jgi:hypothetical protein
MKPLFIIEETSTPKVNFNIDSGRFEISGNSLPENAIEFYNPVINWIVEYLKQPNRITEIDLRFNYFSSSSWKILLDILTMFEEITKNGKSVIVNWHYLEMDQDMFETGREFESLLKIPFNFVPFL